jgi:MinD superfamily P-loop ATPase
MREIVVLSGKGGTGKTTVTAAFASLAAPAVVADCDVDAADLHLVLAPDVLESYPFFGGMTARIDPELCSACGECLEMCRFEAVQGPCLALDGAYRIAPESCEGCGVCARFCPSGAVRMENARSGEYFRSRTRVGSLIHARLEPAGENSGKLVSVVRREAREAAAREGARTILVDGPPGAGCPAIASLTGADFTVIVTEPTPSGFHDLRRVAELVRHFQIPAAVIINKSDLNQRLSEEIGEYAESQGMPIVGSLPYDSAPLQAQIEGKTLMELPGSAFSRRLETIWRDLMEACESFQPALKVL